MVFTMSDSDTTITPVAPVAPPPVIDTKVDSGVAKPVEPVAAPVKPIEVKLDGVSKEDLAAFTKVATESGLDSEKAQKIADLYGTLQSNAKGAAEAKFKLNEALWLQSLKADKDFGGLNGVDLERNKAIAVAALKKSDPELQKVLHETGMGSHPAVVKHFFSLGKSEVEDTISGSKNTPSTKKTDAEILKQLYPSM